MLPEAFNEVSNAQIPLQMLFSKGIIGLKGTKV